MLDTIANQLAETLRERTPGRGHLDCDALSPCESCQIAREAYRAVTIPQQRQGQ